MTDCTFPRCGCSEREQCRPGDAYQAALARAEAAERERDEWRQACLGHGEKANQLQRKLDGMIAANFNAAAQLIAKTRQRDEAFTVGAEAMREAIYNYVYDEAEAMKEQAYNLIEHHSFRPGGRGVSNEAKRKGFIRDRQQIAEKLFIDAAHIRTLPIPAQEGK